MVTYSSSIITNDDFIAFRIHGWLSRILRTLPRPIPRWRIQLAELPAKPSSRDLNKKMGTQTAPLPQPRIRDRVSASERLNDGPLENGIADDRSSQIVRNMAFCTRSFCSTDCILFVYPKRWWLRGNWIEFSHSIQNDFWRPFWTIIFNVTMGLVKICCMVLRKDKETLSKLNFHAIACKSHALSFFFILEKREYWINNVGLKKY